MRTIQYFLIGLFLSLCTIPAFSACPPGMVRNGDFCFLGDQSYYLPDGIGHYIEFDVNNDPYGTWLKNNTSYDFSIPSGYDEVWYQYASYSDADRFDITAWTSDYTGFLYMTPYVDVEGFCTSCLQPLADSFFTQYLLIGGGGGSPQALFNIDGIKENILVTLLSIVGFLLTILSLKYAWRFVGKELLSGGSDGYVTSLEISKDGLTRDTYYSPDGKVERISYSNENAGNEEQDSHKFATGYSEDWDKTLEVSHKEHFEDVTGFPSKASSDDWIDLSGSSPERAALTAEYFDAVRDGYVSPDLYDRVRVAYNIK